MNTCRRRAGFTLIELLLVISVLVIIISISWVAGTNVMRKQTEAKTKAEILLLSNAVKQYKTRWGFLQLPKLPDQHNHRSSIV